MNSNPRVGVGVFIFNSRSQIVLGKRKGSHGAGTHALPGGHLDHSESFERCAAREVMEETGLTVNNIHFLTATNDVMPADGKHYVTIFMGCTLSDMEDQPHVMEPDKCEWWEWVSWRAVRDRSREEEEEEEEGEGKKSEGEGRRLFLPLRNLVRQRVGFDPVESYMQEVRNQERIR